MGLDISVGLGSWAGDEEAVASYRREMDRLSQALAERGVTWRCPEDTAWTGPQSTPPFMRKHVSGFSYGFIHYLRRVQALVNWDEPVTPARGPADLARDDEKVADVATDLSSHLICHSDADGYYVPVDFDDPLFLSKSLPGAGMVGSSQGLLAELRECAPVIGVRLEPDGSLSDAEATRLYELPEDAPFAIESMVWLTLHEMCRASISTGHAIVFH